MLAKNTEELKKSDKREISTVIHQERVPDPGVRYINDAVTSNFKVIWIYLKVCRLEIFKKLTVWRKTTEIAKLSFTEEI